MPEIRIFCPKCRWVPQPADRWQCAAPCLCVWNTFETCGVCPQCGRNWDHTQCLACHQWSPHVDWYHDLAPKDAVQEQDQPALPEPALPN